MKSSFLLYSKRWSALLIGIFVTTIISVIAIYLLEKIVPFSRDIKGIENGNVSYYRANTALNEALLTMSGSDPSIQGSSGTMATGNVYQITANGNTLPRSGLGNSEYDKDWAILAPGKPIQLVLNSASSLDWSLTNFKFRVPDLDKNGSWVETLTGWTLPIINWSLTASGETLQSSGSYILASEINGSNIFLSTRNWLTLSGSASPFGTFYNTKCTSSITCTLKLSLVNPLILSVTGESVPYLEYLASFDKPISLQTATIETQWYAWGFRKNITRFIQQTTTNEALDFTVFQ